MKTENKIPLNTICERFAKRLNYNFITAHLAVLMHCWRNKHPDEAPSFDRLKHRKFNDGYAWLNPRELTDLSRYAGYDVTHE